MTPLEKLGLIICAVGALATAVNLYVGPIRYLHFVWSGRPRSEWHYVSGIPVFGSLFLWVGCLFLTAEPGLMWTAIAVSLFDYGGLHWLIGTMIYMTWFHHLES